MTQTIFLAIAVAGLVYVSGQVIIMKKHVSFGIMCVISFLSALVVVLARG